VETCSIRSITAMARVFNNGVTIHQRA